MSPAERYAKFVIDCGPLPTEEFAGLLPPQEIAPPVVDWPKETPEIPELPPTELPPVVEAPPVVLPVVGPVGGPVPTPEPESLVLTATGLALVGIAKRKR
jgi:hypothetical protein